MNTQHKKAMCPPEDERLAGTVPINRCHPPPSCSVLAPYEQWLRAGEAMRRRMLSAAQKAIERGFLGREQRAAFAQKEWREPPFPTVSRC